MEKNVGGNDRFARLIVGTILIVLGLAAIGNLIVLVGGSLGLAIAVVLVLLGAVLVATGATQTCPLNSMLGIDTYGGERTREDSQDESTGGDLGESQG